MKLLLRSMLFVPANNPVYIEKALTSDADAIIFDLEDAVAPDGKQIARDILSPYLNGICREINNKLFFVRVNPPNSAELFSDLDASMRDTITGFIIPKTETEHDIHFISRLLTLLERERGYDDGRFLLAPMIEGVRAVTHIRDISISSSRIAAICFGGYDFRNDIKVISGSNPLFQLVPRALIAIAARSADVLPIDTPYFNIDDPDGLIAEKEEAAALGFAGSMVITPRHIETVNRCFSPSDENIAYARGVLCALDNAAASNSSYAKYDGLMIDAPIKSLAEYIMLYADIVNRKSTEVINGRTA